MTVPELLDKILDSGAAKRFTPNPSAIIIRHELKSTGQVFMFDISGVRLMPDGNIAIVTDGQEIK